MGFFSGLVSSPKVTTPASGLYAQTPQYQQLYNTIANNTNAGINNINSQMFTPDSLYSGEQNAVNNMYQGFTPTADTLQSDISMLQNPYDQYVTEGINREAMGENSLVNQSANQAGQIGSNRSFLGSSDVEQNRLNKIGQFKQSQYNNAINQSLGALTNNRRQDSLGALSAGSYNRDLNSQIARAPYTALQAQQSLLGGLNQVQGNEQKTSGGGFSLGQTAQTAGQLAAIAGFFSDERLKENIEDHGEENGHKLYKYNYKGYAKKFIGVIAQEVEKSTPEAVFEVDGFKAVNYDMLGIKFREAE